MRKQICNRNEIFDSNKSLLLSPNHKSTIKSISAHFNSNHNINHQIPSKLPTKDLSNHTVRFWNKSFRNSNGLNSGRNTNITKAKAVNPPLSSNRLLKNSTSRPIYGQLGKQMMSIINNERAITIKKKSIKGRFNHLLNHSHIYNELMFQEKNELFHHSPETKRRIKKLQKRKEDNKSKGIHRCSSAKNFNFHSKPDLFLKERTYFRYEDYYQSPESFLKQNFSTEELTMMVTQPRYFNLKAPPFLGSSVNIIEKLGDLLNQEEIGKVIDFDEKRGDKWLFKDKRDQDKANKHKQKNKIIKSNSSHKCQSLTPRINHNGLSLKPKTKPMNKEIKQEQEEEEEEQQQQEVKNMYSSLDYEKLFEIIEQRKIYSLSKRQNLIMNKKQKFEEMKNKNMKMKINSENEMIQTRLLLNKLEKNYLELTFVKRQNSIHSPNK